MPLFGDKARELEERLARLGVRPEDLEESFVHSGGKGGQNVNKVATCVVLVHRPTGIAVKCQRERTQGANRLHRAAHARRQDRGAAPRRRQQAPAGGRTRPSPEAPAIAARRSSGCCATSTRSRTRRRCVAPSLTTDLVRRDRADLRRVAIVAGDDAVRARRGGAGWSPSSIVKPTRRGARGRDDPALLDLGCGTGTLLAEVQADTARLAPGRRRRERRDAGRRARQAGARSSPKLAGTSDVTFARTHLGAPLPFPAAFDVCTALLRHAEPPPGHGGARAHVRRRRDGAASGRPAGLRRHQPPRVRGLVGSQRHRSRAPAGGCPSTRASTGRPRSRPPT